MNKIYRVIWSAVTQQWVTVSELAPARGKSRSAVCASVVALTLGIGASFTSNAMPVVIAKPGEAVELGETVVSSEGGSIRADSTVQARGVDAIIITNDTTITADGQAVSAVYALNGGRVEINGGKLVTGESNRLRDSHAVVASSDGKVVIKNAEINTYGQNGAGASTEGGSVELTDTKIKTALGPGVRSTSKSGELVMNGGSIDSGGYGAYAQSGAQLTLNDVTVVSQGVGAQANSGSTITINGGSFETNGNYAYGLYANNPDNSFIDLSSEKKTEILTSGVGSHGAYVLSSRIKLNGDSIKTTGDNAYGLYALGNKKGDAAVISAAQAEVVTTGVGAHAVRAMNSDAMVEVIGLTVVKEDGSEEVKKSSITTTGENSNGLYASSGAYINVAQATITTSGVSSAGAAATTGSKIDLNSVEIVTTGQAASGLWVDNAQINADDVTIKTYGEPGKSTASTGASLFNGASLLLSNSSIETLKDKGMGVDVLSGSNATLINSSITTHGDLSTGVAVWNASANLDQVVINTSGQNARGVVSRGDTASVLVAGSTLNTEGQGSYGIHATEGGKASVNGSQLQTAGDQAYGVAAIENSAVQLNDSTVRTNGASASLYAKQGSRIDMEGGSIVANHAMGRAIEFSSQQGLEDVIRLDGTQVAAVGTAISAHGDGVSRLELANSTLASASGSLLLVNESGVDQRFVLDASNSQLSGDAWVDAASQAEINLAKQSNWQGKASGLGALSVSEDSVWNITGSSDVAALNLQGTAAFAAPTSGDFKTLTVKSDYVGQNGTVVLNTYMGDDSSATDKLIFDGGAVTGNTNLVFKHAGGDGAQTQQGIRVVETQNGATTTAEAFVLDARSDGYRQGVGTLAHGAYDYRLARGGNGGETEDWYLVSAIAPTNPPSPEEKIGPPEAELAPRQPPSVSEPVYRPEVGGYLANRQAALNMQVHTLRERQAQAPGVGGNGGEPSNNSWFRIAGSQTDWDANGLTGNGTEQVVHFGSDVARFSAGANGKVHLGVMGQYSRHTGSVDNGWLSASHKADGVSGGVYGTWYGHQDELSGPYIDTWLMYGRFNNQVQGQGLSGESYHSQVFTGSVEGGYSFKIDERPGAQVYLQPQVQLIYSDYRADDHKESTGTMISGQSMGTVLARLGVRLQGDFQNEAKQTRMRPFAELNWWYNNRGSQGMNFDAQQVSLDLPSQYGEFKVGLQGNLSKRLEVWGSAGVKTDMSSFTKGSLQGGVKYNW